MTYKCKYCRALTEHTLVHPTEKFGKPAHVYRCYVCKHDSLIYRDPKTKQLVIDQSEVPERVILLPYDKEYQQLHPTTKEEENAHKDIDDWLKSDELWLGYRKSIDKDKN